MRLLSVITFSSIIALAAVSSAATALSATSIRNNAAYKPYAGTLNKKGQGDYKACQTHYKANPEYATLIKQITELRKQEKALRRQIKDALKKAGKPCPSQEYTIEVGEAIVAGLQAQIAKLQAISRSVVSK